MKHVQQGRLTIVGLGPGSRDLMAPRAQQAIQECDLVIGYRGYMEQIWDLIAGKKVYESELTHEIERATMAVRFASAGSSVCIVSSGDAGIYGMAGLVLDILHSHPAVQSMEEASSVHKDNVSKPLVEIVPGISALNAAAALLGAPLMHDFAVISLSDLLTPWEVIARRLSAAAAADFVVVLYNPSSKRRTWQLAEAQRLLLQSRLATTPVGLVRNAYRSEQKVWVTMLGKLHNEAVDMFTTVVIGNSCTVVQRDHMVTPRGYDRKGE